MNDAKLEQLIKPLIRIYDNLELELIKDIAIRLNTYDGVKGSLKWYLDKLQAIGGFNQDNLALLAEYAGKSQKEVKEILKYAGYDTSKLDKYKSIIDNETLLKNPSSLYESVAVQNIINNAIKETNSIMETIQTKALESAKESYMKILTDSYIKVSSGIYSYDTAIKQGLKEMAKNGFTGATYSNGKEISLESTVRRDVLTKCHQLAGDIELEKAKELGTNLVYVTQHLGARIRTKYTKEDYEVHAEWQGKVYMINGSNDKYDNFYEKTGYGEMLGLCGVNCRHHFYATKEGWSHPELINKKENEEAYLKQQEQRNYERRIRQLKREKEVAKQLDDKEELKSINSRYSKFNKEYNKFLEENNLSRDYSREYIEKGLIKTNNDNLDYNGMLAKDEIIKDDNYKTRVIEIGNIDKNKKMDAINFYEEKIVNAKVENAIIVQDDGKIIRCIGKEDGVGIYGSLKDAIVTHNHPTFNEEIGGSFGKDDWQFLVNNYKNNVTLRAIDKKYKYQIKIKKDINMNDYQDAYKKCKLIDNDYKHCVMIYLKERGIIDYERKSRK